MPLRYLLWDMDGTLFDTYPAMTRALVRAFADLGVTVPAELVASLISRTFEHCLDTLCPRHGLDQEAVLARYRQHYRETGVEEQPPFPGVMRVCRRVVQAGGANYIFTHRGRDSLDRFLNFYGVADLFADTLTVDDGYPRKPDPGGFLALIEKHHLPKSAVLVIGDRELDILAGQAAGVKTCLFGEPEPGLAPDYVIGSYEELEAILELD